MLEPGAFFEVADGELDDGVAAVELVRGGGVVVGVGDECVVSPVGPQSLLCALSVRRVRRTTRRTVRFCFAAAGGVLVVSATWARPSLV